ncbi:alpha/beta fold hydrolase [uncultured Corynebacterium sp.]|uniref:alpha/beta fold hydrolase n=1 Tax=uncultured Corynebacterium sp. TaxID=159447 RepID=UPI00261326A7|nr:alpha/beta fold hydrolase [uncultured Corynebacterium sp.]
MRLIEPLFNDPDFTPTHPTPVLYVHGIHSRTSGFRRNARFLRDHGYWVWGFDYGNMFLPGLYGTGPLEDSLEELRANVDRVLEETGAEQVDIVAHSQGGLLTRLYIEHGGSAKVRRVVAMGANFHGTDMLGRAPRILKRFDQFPTLTRVLLTASVQQQLAGSTWMRENADPLPDTDPSVVYTNLYSTRDTLVTPIATSMLKSVDGADVVNIPVPGEPIHQLMMRDKEICELTLWGLERPVGKQHPN